MNVIIKKVEELKLLEKKKRRHTEKQLDEFVKSIEKFGQTRPAVIDEDNNVLIGNGMVMALKKMGAEKCAVFVKEGLTDKQKKKLILSDNQIYKLGQDDFQSIEEFIIAIDEVDIPGFDDDYINSFLQTEEELKETFDNFGVIDREEVEVIKTRETQQEPVISKPKANDVEVEAEVEVETKVEEALVTCPHCGEKFVL